MLRVGLTGGIASGKSTVAARLAAQGLSIVDLDQIAHAVVARGRPALDEVVATFGRDILDDSGQLDRRALGRRVFADEDALRRLNAIVHPRVRAEEALRAEAARAAGVSCLVSEAAILIDAGSHLRFDRVAVAHVEREGQLRRLRARDGWGEDEARRRVDAQMPADLRRRLAHFSLDTSGSVDSTNEQADRLAASLIALAGELPRAGHLSAPLMAQALCLGPLAGLTRSGCIEFLEATVEGLELGRLVQRLVPGWQGPWYRARVAEQIGLAGLVVPAVGWARSLRGADADYLLGVLASLAQLLGGDARTTGNACLFGLSLAGLLAGEPAAGVLGQWPAYRSAAERWAGAAFEDDVRPLVEAALGGVARSGETSRRVQGDRDADVVGALTGALGVDGGHGLPDGIPDVVLRWLDSLSVGTTVGGPIRLSSDRGD